ncbi:MAG: SPW repeat protein [Saccharothrix sp.]|nr:SPW repeat protein [Saccharothrix sp.]
MVSDVPQEPPVRRSGELDPMPIAAQGHQPVVHSYSSAGPLAPFYRGRDPVAAGVASGVAFVAGVWLALAPFALDYAPSGEGFKGYWHDIVVGAAIALLALVRSLAPRHVPWLSLVNVTLGVWLLFAPVVLGYRSWPGSTTAAVNNVVVGVVVIGTALVSAYATYRRRAQDDSPEGVS